MMCRGGKGIKRKWKLNDRRKGEAEKEKIRTEEIEKEKRRQYFFSSVCRYLPFLLIRLICFIKTHVKAGQGAQGRPKRYEEVKNPTYKSHLRMYIFQTGRQEKWIKLT